MEYYVIIGRDTEDSKSKRKSYRAQHLKRLKKLEHEGKLLLAGPFSDGSGSLMVLKMTSIEEAKEFIECDPYYLNGVYRNVEIKSFDAVLPSKGQ